MHDTDQGSHYASKTPDIRESAVLCEWVDRARRLCSWLCLELAGFYVTTWLLVLEPYSGLLAKIIATSTSPVPYAVGVSHVIHDETGRCE